jgi:hypothetical protein
VIPAGTLNVPDDVNDSITGAFTVRENALSLMLELTSLALMVKFEVVFEPTSSASPEITAPEDVEVKDKPAGNEPDSKV